MPQFTVEADLAFASLHSEFPRDRDQWAGYTVQ